MPRRPPSSLDAPPDNVLAFLDAQAPALPRGYDPRQDGGAQDDRDAPIEEPPAWMLDDFPTAQQLAPNRMPDVPDGERRYKLLTGDDLAALPPIQWRVRGIFPTTGLASIYGASMSGKSFLAFDLACAIAEGSDWFGSRVTACPVVYVCLEGEAGYSLRAKAWEQRNARNIPADLRFVLQPFALTNGADLVELAAAIADIVPTGAVLIVDTLNRAAPGVDENSSKDMGAIIEASKRLQERLAGLVVLVSHTGKDSSKGLRGHSSLIAALDAAIEVTRNDDARAWTAAKVKDGRDGQTHAFALQIESLGRDDEGDEITSCVIGSTGIPPAQPKAQKLTPGESLGLRSFETAASVNGRKDRFGNLLGVHIDHWRQAFYSGSTADTQHAKKMAFQRARESLVAKGRMAVSEDVYRITGGGNASV